MDEWLRIYERYNPSAAVEWVEQLAAAAILHGLPCYEDGVKNAGAAGWRRMVERYRGEGGSGQEVKQEATNDELKTTNEPPRGLPWETNK